MALKPEEITQGVYKGRTPIGPGVYQNLILLVRGSGPLYEIRVIVNRNDGLEDFKNPIGYINNGFLIVDEKVCEL